MYDALGLGMLNLRHGISPYLDISGIRVSLHTDLCDNAYLGVCLGKQAVD